MTLARARSCHGCRRPSHDGKAAGLEKNHLAAKIGGANAEGALSGAARKVASDRPLRTTIAVPHRWIATTLTMDHPAAGRETPAPRALPAAVWYRRLPAESRWEKLIHQRMLAGHRIHPRRDPSRRGRPLLKIILKIQLPLRAGQRQDRRVAEHRIRWRPILRVRHVAHVQAEHPRPSCYRRCPRQFAAGAESPKSPQNYG